MKIGVRGHDLGKYENISDVAYHTREVGFDFIQLVLKKSLKNETGFLDDERVKMIKNEFSKHQVEIAMLGAYFNPIHSNKKNIERDIQAFEAYLKYANMLGCKYVGTETGSYNDDVWTYHPKNHTQGAYDEVVKVMKELTLVAEKYNSYVAVEPAYNHVIHNVDSLKKLIEDINSEHLVITIDLFNLLTIHNYNHHKEIFTEYVNNFREKIKIFHFKDFIVSDNELERVGIGEGLMDYKFIIKLINEKLPESYVIFEGVPESKLKASLDYINNLNKN